MRSAGCACPIQRADPRSRRSARRPIHRRAHRAGDHRQRRAACPPPQPTPTVAHAGAGLTLFVRQSYPRSAQGGRVKKRLSFRVREELAARIASGRVAPGAKLPAEPELAEELGRIQSDAPGGAALARGGRVRHAGPAVRDLRHATASAQEQPRRELRRHRGHPSSGDARRHDADRRAYRGRVGTGRPGPRSGGQVSIVVLERVRTADGRPVVFSRDHRLDVPRRRERRREHAGRRVAVRRCSNRSVTPSRTAS